jgi:ligand-binding SRPBCC domain-containing protein
MTFSISTNVAQSYLEVAQKFDLQLFEALAPPFPKVKVVRFDGCKKGDEVRIEMSILGLKQQWNALIVEQAENDTEWYFIDEGTALPFPLKYWRHRHRVVHQTDGTSRIIDEITYQTPFRIMDFLTFPLFYLQFAARKPIYQKYFSK